MKPGIKTLIAGVALLVLGAFVIPPLVILPIFLRDADEVRFTVPGRATATVEQPGAYYLWNEHQTMLDGTTYNQSEQLPHGVRIRIHNADGQPRDFKRDTSISSSRNDTAKKSIGYVEVDRPGELTIEVTGDIEQRVFSFSRSTFMEMIGWILAAVILSPLVALAGIGLIVWGIVKLTQSNRDPTPPTNQSTTAT